MSEHQDHSQSGFEPGDPGDTAPGGGAGGAERFWGDYARSGQGRAGSRRETGNGQGAARQRAEHTREHGHECVEWCPICRTADVLRASSSPELRQQWQSLQRDAVETLKALLEAYVERLDTSKRPAEARVEDIPIE
jgi:hypothetical protein